MPRNSSLGAGDLQAMRPSMGRCPMESDPTNVENGATAATDKALTVRDVSSASL